MMLWMDERSFRDACSGWCEGGWLLTDTSHFLWIQPLGGQSFPYQIDIKKKSKFVCLVSATLVSNQGWGHFCISFLLVGHYWGPFYTHPPDIKCWGVTSLMPLSNWAGTSQQVKNQAADLGTSFWPRHWALKSQGLWKVPLSLMAANVRASTLLPMDRNRNLWSLNTCLLQPCRLLAELKSKQLPQDLWQTGFSSWGRSSMKTAPCVCLGQAALLKCFWCGAPLVREVAEQLCRYGKSNIPIAVAPHWQEVKKGFGAGQKCMD